MQYTPQGHTARESNTQGEKTYHYNGAERLIGYASQPEGHSTPNIEAHYRYDPLGRRIAKQVKEGQTTQVTYYFYSDTGLLGETDAQGQMTKAYGFDPQKAQQGLWSTDPLWQANVTNNSLTGDTTSYHYLHTDHLATPILATYKAGNPTWKGISEAFGVTKPTIQAMEMNLRFPGQYWDYEKNSHYNFNRDYLQGMGRYLQGDPVGLMGGVNFYGYVEANPVSKIDPEGLQWTTVENYCRQNPRSCIFPPPGIPVPIKPPNQEEEKCERCSDYPYNRYVPCDKLHMYMHNSFNSAYAELRMINGGRALNRGKNKPAERGPCGEDSGYAVGQHIVFTSSSIGRAGSLVSCECCEQRADGVKILEKWAVIP